MLTNTTNVARYLINTTPLSTYSISFPYWDKEEIKVYLTKADGTLETLVEGTNYTLTTPNGVSGTLTRVGDWTAGATNLTIMREMDLTQEVDLRNGDKIDAETLETAFDTATAQIQQLSEAQSRAVTTSVDEAGGNLAIPSKALRAGSGSGTMMGFGPDGNEVVLRDLAGFDADVASAASNASSASASAGTATTQALKSEGYAVGEQNGSPVTSGSPYYQNNSKHYAQVAKAGADVITDNLTAITNLDTNMTDINAVADDISNVVAVAGDLTKVDAVADDLTNIDAVNANKTNIDTVAGIASDVTNVAGVASDIPTVAGVSTDISTVATDISDVSAVAGDLVKVKAVADDLTNIDAVNSNKTNIDTVAGKTSEITTVASKANDVTTVAGIASNVTTVAGKATEVTTVAGIASDVSAVAQVASDVASVADELTDIGTVASNISDVAAVGADIAKVSAVADDLTSIDAVYADLANIDAADDHALEAEGWAAGTQNGVPVTSGSPYYENNAKYYGQEIPNLKSAIDNNSQRIENLEVAVSGSLVQTNVLTDPPSMANTRTITNANEILPWAILKRVGARMVAWNQLFNTVIDSTTSYNIVFTKVDGHTLTISGTASAFVSKGAGKSFISSIVNGHTYLIRGMESNTQNVGLIANGYNGTTWVKTFSGRDTGSGLLVTIDNSSVNRLSIEEVIENGTVLSKTYTIIPQVHDLTTMNEASLTADQFKAKFPASYYPQDAGHIYNLNPSAFKVVGKNKFANAISIISGGGYYSSGDMYLPKGSYILTFNNVSAYSIKYWLNGSNVSDTGTKSLGAGASASFSFSMSESGIMSFGGRHDPADSNAQVSELTELMIRPSTTSATYEPYSETTIDTSFTSDYKYVNEGCHDYSENVLVNGVMRREEQTVVGQIDLHDIPKANWERVTTATADAYRFQTSGNLIPVKKPANDTTVANIICSKLKPITANNTYNNVEGVAIGAASGRVLVYADAFKAMSVDDFYTAISSGYILNYELATPSTPTLHDPIPNIQCEDGTTVTAITPQTDLVNAIDVPSTIAYMTKIGG